jgi:hypothetical protein
MTPQRQWTLRRNGSWRAACPLPFICHATTPSMAPTTAPAVRQPIAGERSYTRAMPAQPTNPRTPVRRSRPARRVILECVVRRDAAQRLSLVLSLLVRASGLARECAPGERAWRPDEPAPHRQPYSREEEQRS